MPEKIRSVFAEKKAEVVKHKCTTLTTDGCCRNRVSASDFLAHQKHQLPDDCTLCGMAKFNMCRRCAEYVIFSFSTALYYISHCHKRNERLRLIHNVQLFNLFCPCLQRGLEDAACPWRPFRTSCGWVYPIQSKSSFSSE